MNTREDNVSNTHSNYQEVIVIMLWINNITFYILTFRNEISICLAVFKIIDKGHLLSHS